MLARKDRISLKTKPKKCEPVLLNSPNSGQRGTRKAPSLGVWGGCTLVAHCLYYVFRCALFDWQNIF